MLYHMSFFPVKQFYPRIPCFRCENENMDIPRISFSDISKLEALRAIPSSDRILKKMLDLEIYPTLYAYSMAKESCTTVKTPSQEAAGIRLLPCLETQEYVPDARYTGECWVLDPPDMKNIICKKYRVLDIELDEQQPSLFRTMEALFMKALSLEIPALEPICCQLRFHLESLMQEQKRT